MISRVQIQPLWGILASYLPTNHTALPRWLLDCPAAIVGSSDIVDDPNDIDVLVWVEDIDRFTQAIDATAKWHYTGSYPGSLFVSVKSNTSLPVNILATDDTEFFKATLLAQEAMLGIHEHNREAFKARRHRVSLFDTIYQAYKTPDAPETPDDNEGPF